MNVKKIWDSYKFPLLLLGGIFTGAILGKILGSLVCTFIVTGGFAAALVLVVVNIWPPAANTAIAMGASEMAEASSISDMIAGSLTANDFSGLMSRSNMLPIIVFAIMSGFAVAKCGGEESWVSPGC